MITKNNVPFLIYAATVLVATCVYIYLQGCEARMARAAALAVQEVDCTVSADGEDAKVQPVARREPDFQNIYQPEYIVLQFDLNLMGEVKLSSIKVLRTTSQRLIAPAVLAVADWRYCPQINPNDTQSRSNVRVASNVQPPDPATYDFWQR